MVPYTEEDKDSKITKLMVQKFELEAHGPEKCVIPFTVTELVDHLQNPGQCFVAAQSGIMNTIRHLDNYEGPIGREILGVLMEDPQTANLLAQSEYRDVYQSVLRSKGLRESSTESVENRCTEKASVGTATEFKTFKILQTT